jgi:hypothetical protein
LFLTQTKIILKPTEKICEIIDDTASDQIPALKPQTNIEFKAMLRDKEIIDDIKEALPWPASLIIIAEV